MKARTGKRVTKKPTYSHNTHLLTVSYGEYISFFSIIYISVFRAYRKPAEQ